MPEQKAVVVATTGHGTPAGPHVPRTGEGHGSANLVLHEGAHAYDHTGTTEHSTSEEFGRARTADARTLSAYEAQAGSAGKEESYAESAARYYSGDSADSTQHPNLHEYWKAQ